MPSKMFELEPDPHDQPVFDLVEQLATQLRIDLTALPYLMLEDWETGWDNELGSWPAGSMYGIEGQLLYGLIRRIEPERIVEIGRFYGCSTTHMSLAVKANAVGSIRSVDLEAPHHRVREELLPYVDFIQAEGVQWLNRQPDNSIDFLLEDTAHTVEVTQAMAEAIRPKMKKGGIVVHHDGAHYRVGAEVRQGLTNADVPYQIYKFPEAACGFAIWVKEN